MTQQQKDDYLKKAKEWLGGIFKPANALNLIVLLYCAGKLSVGGIITGYREGAAFVDTCKQIQRLAYQTSKELATYKADQQVKDDSINAIQVRVHDSLRREMHLLAKQP